MGTGNKSEGKLKVSHVQIIKSTVRNFTSNDGFFLSAGLAYYGLFSIVPLAILTISVTGLFLGSQTAAEAEANEAIVRVVGQDVADLLTRVFEDMSSRGSVAGTVIGAILLLYGATRLFLKLQSSFNTMWGVRLSTSQPPYRIVLSRLLTLSMILLPAAILFAAFVLSTGISWLATQGWVPWLQKSAEALGPFLVTWSAIATLMLILPDVRLTMGDCVITSLVATVICYGTTRAFGAWMVWSSKATGVVLTSVSVIMTLMIWANVMAIVMLMSVSLTRAIYEAKGKTIRPYRQAAVLKVTFEEIPAPDEPDK